MKIADSWFKHLIEIVEEENKTKEFLELIKNKYPNMSDDEIKEELWLDAEELLIELNIEIL